MRSHDTRRVAAAVLLCCGLSVANAQPAAPFCASAMADLWIANDESLSVSGPEFRAARDFVFRLSDNFDFDAETGLTAGLFGWGRNTVNRILPLTDTFSDPDDSGFQLDRSVVTDGDGTGVRELFVFRPVNGTTTLLNVMAEGLRDRIINPLFLRRSGVVQIPLIITDAAALDYITAGSVLINRLWEISTLTPEPVYPIMVLVDESADAYRNSPAAKAVIDAAVGNGVVVLADSYADLADPVSGAIDRVASAICGVATSLPGEPAIFDYGDAPASYSGATPLGVGGHFILSSSATLLLGNTVDAEALPLHSTPATGDDSDGAVDDEDGVTSLPLLLETDSVYTVPADRISASGTGTLHAWIDFDRNGLFASSEHVSVAVNDGVLAADLSWTGLPVLAPGNTFLRLRLTSDDLSDDGMGATADIDERAVVTATDGEIEDYAITIEEPLDYGDAPDTYSTLDVSDGARHVVLAGVALGSDVDEDDDGFGNGVENGVGLAADDDDADRDDEDAVASPAALPPLLTSDRSYRIAALPVVNTTGADAYVVGWIDLNQNGVFDSSEASSVATAASGAASVDLDWPTIDGQLAGNTYLRLRISTDRTLLSRPLPTGLLTDGEVEDHLLTVSAALSVTKQTIPDGREDLFDIDVGAALTVTLGDNASSGFVGVAPGTVTVTETPNAAPDLDPVLAVVYSCSDGFNNPVASGLATTTGSAAGEITRATFDVTVPAAAASGAEQTISCSLFNIEQAEVTFIKQALPADGEDFDFAVIEPAPVLNDFDFTLDGEPVDDDGDRQINELDVVFDVDPSAAPATYDYIVTERVPADWELVDFSCVDLAGTVVGATASAGELTLALDPGDRGLCTATNRQLGTIIVDVVTAPSGDPTAFAFASDFAGGFALTDGDAALVTNALSAGGYSVTTQLPPGWTQASARCDDGSDPSTITLQPGEIVTCVFTNQASGPLANPDSSSGNVTGTIATIEILANDSDPQDNIDPSTVALDPASVSGGVGSDGDGDGDIDRIAVADQGVWSVDDISGVVAFTPCRAAALPDAVCSARFTGDPDPIDYVVSDTTRLTSPPARITVDYLQNSPVAADDRVGTAEATAVSFDVINGSGPDSDADGDLDPATTTTGCAVCSLPASGSLSDLGNGVFEYLPDAGFVGADSFIYQVCDATGLCDTATVDITVSDGGTPVANADSNATQQDSAVSGNAFDNDILADAAALRQFQPVSDSGGAVTMDADGSYTFTPALGFSGIDQFFYTICDNDRPEPECSSAEVIISVSDLGTPQASPDSNSTVAGAPVSGNVFDNDSLADNAALDRFDSVSSGGGTVQLNGDGSYVYTPPSGFVGVDTFDYTICDDDRPVAECSTAAVTISVVANPTAVDDLSSGNVRGTSVAVAVLVNDSGSAGEPLDPASIDLDASAIPGAVGTDSNGDGDIDRVVVPGQGVWSVNNVSGIVTFTPDDGLVGDPAAIRYTAATSAGLRTSAATLTIRYTQNPPLAVADAATTPADTPVTIPVAANDSDPDGDLDDGSAQLIDPDSGAPVQSVTIAGQGVFVVTCPACVVTFTPDAGFSGDVNTVEYLIFDSAGQSARAAIRVRVTTSAVAIPTLRWTTLLLLAAVLFGSGAFFIGGLRRGAAGDRR